MSWVPGMPLPPVEKQVVTLKYKGNELIVPKPDWRTTVTDLVRIHGKILGLPYRSCPMANGVRVMDGYQPRWGDVISFVELGPCEV